MERGLWSEWDSVVAAMDAGAQVSSCSTPAQLPRSSVWDLPGPWIEPVSSVLAGGFFTSEPPGKPPLFFGMKVSYFLTLKQVFSSFFES